MAGISFSQAAFRKKDTSLTDPEVLEEAQMTLQQQLELEAHCYKCMTEELLSVLPAVVTGQGTVEPACANLVGTPDAERIRSSTNEQLRIEQLPELVICPYSYARPWRTLRRVACHAGPTEAKMAMTITVANQMATAGQ